MENKTPTLSPDPTTDLTAVDLVEVNRFIESGLPGIASVPDSTIEKIAKLYLEGKTYNQISRILRVPVVIPMYLARRGNWYTTRLRHKHELAASLQGRIMDAQLVTQERLLSLVQHFEKRIGHIVDKFDATDDATLQVNLKEVDKYLKTVKALQEGMAPKSPKDKTPAVGLNIGAGVTVTKTGDNSVEISPTQKTVEQMMAEIADSLRAAEVPPKANDIKEVTDSAKPEGERE